MTSIEPAGASHEHEVATGEREESTTTLSLQLESGAKVEIEIRYDDPKAAIQAIKGISQDKYLFRLAVGIGAIDGYEFVDDGDDA
ncbi:hypothetical protein [Gordonia sp. (in: high G+C Gram-positive bacteria)]|uniref:hypothetical protein n=1 Tax=Gordonia sp. (in: high G+C Gram-positive bacteria) TaxID=84139 RepID=UPI003C777EEA